MRIYVLKCNAYTDFQNNICSICLIESFSRICQRFISFQNGIESHIRKLRATEKIERRKLNIGDKYFCEAIILTY